MSFISGVGNLVNTFSRVLNTTQNFLSSPVGQAATTLLRQLAGSRFTPGGSSNQTGNTRSLPNPLSRLMNLLGTAGRIAGTVGNVVSRVSNVAQGIQQATSASTGRSGVDGAIRDAGSLGGAGLSRQQRDLLNTPGLDENAKRDMTIQMKMQNLMRMTQTLTNIMQMKHEMAMGIVRNIRG
jgi:hypothetical protein